MQNPFKNYIQRLKDLYKLHSVAYAGYKKHLLVLVALGLLAGFLEAIGVNALIPLFSFFSEEPVASVDFVSRTIEKLFSILHIDFSLPMILVFISLLFILKSMVLFVFGYIRILIRAGYEQQAMDSLFTNTLAAEWPYLKEQKIGYLETVMKIDIRKGGGSLYTIANFAVVVTGLFIFLLIALNISETITALTLLAGGVIFFVSKPLFYKARKVAKRTTDLQKEIARHVNEQIIGMKSVKIMAAEKPVGHIGSVLFEHLKRLQVRSTLLKQLATVFIQPVGIILISIIVAFSFYHTSYNLGALAAIIYLIQRIFSYMQSLQEGMHKINNNIPFIQSLLYYQEKAKASREKKKHYGSDDFIFTKDISFNNVSFSHDDRKDTLDDINFTIPKGNMVGIIGVSGAGKTTLFDIVLRLFEPSKGSITIDGKNIQDIDMYKWRKGIGYLSQEIFIINDTVANNIRFYDKSITDEDVVRVAKMVHMHEDIMHFPKGYDTLVGEQGSSISAGQRQRIVIARALARKPQLLLLDEATSALDAGSEKYIEEAIAGLKGKVTVLVIAHRISTVQDVDELIVLDQGKIVERGKPKDLLKDKDTYFYKIHNLR